MMMIEIKPLSNGAHRNQTAHKAVPDGWAVIPEGMELENFPFGTVTAENGVVTGWVPGVMPPAVEPEPTEAEQMRADLDFLMAMGGYVV